jgi:hypothetical protein
LDETSKVALALFAFHRGLFVAVDQPSLSLRSARVTQFGYNVGGRFGHRLEALQMSPEVTGRRRMAADGGQRTSFNVPAEASYQGYAEDASISSGAGRSQTD